MNKCFYCDVEEGDGVTLEKHHVFGRNNSEMTVLACPTCHQKITYRQQKGIPKKARTKEATSKEQFAFGMLSLGAHQKKLWDEVIRQSKEQLKDGA